MTEQSSPPPEELSARELTVQLADRVGTLLRQELALAKAEMFVQARQAALSGGILATAVAVAGVGSLAVVAACIAAVAIVWPPWAACAIVGGGFVVIGGGVAALAARRLSIGFPPLPLTVANLRRDVEEIRARARR